ncbi:glycosyltransferase [Candidatus Falkowbacteria bacterium]|nr:glycosyltransferase [Candidatus Falkowbacteria bacterium]
MSLPRVSVVMSVYNGGEHLKDAVKSILDQSFAAFEFIIINDGSTDGSEAVINGFSDPRIRLVSRENKGLVYSLNQGIELAQTDLIVRMDADDVAAPDRLEKQLHYLDEHPEISLVGSWAKTIDSVGSVTGEYNYPPVSYGKIKAYAIIHNPFIHPTVMFRKTAIVSVGGYNPRYKHIEDYELWSRVLNRYQGANLPEHLLFYRLSGQGITKSHNLEMRLKGLVVRLLVIKRLFLHY